MHPEEPSCAMKVNVHLPSGDGCSIEVSPETPISELKAAAQQHFQRRLTLTAQGGQLDLTATVTSPELAPLVFFGFCGVPLFSTHQAKKIIFCRGPNSSLGE